MKTKKEEVINPTEIKFSFFKKINKFGIFVN